MNGNAGWYPILDGTLREEALEAVDCISASLRASASASGRPVSDTMPRASLAGGEAGLALFHAYLAQAGRGSVHEQAAMEHLDLAIETLSSMRMNPSLYGGFTGIGWTVQHLVGRLLDPEGDDVNEAIDEAVAAHARTWEGHYDLIVGLVGLGVYALERLPAPGAADCLAQVIERLAESAERLPEGATWWTPNHFVEPRNRELYPKGYYNLGVAHGVPGVITVLGGAVAAGVAADTARPLLDSAVAWLLAQAKEGAGSRFSVYAGPDVAPAETRVGWCYGDLGVAASLLAVAHAVGSSDWEREALDIARHAAARSREETRIFDACLCHGAAGNGHLFQRMFHATGDDSLREAARFWFERTLAMRRPGEGFGGFPSWTVVGANDEMGFAADPGILMGSAGVALALLAATTSVEPAWDRMLLASLRSRN